jgi:hypothetical protein
MCQAIILIQVSEIWTWKTGASDTHVCITIIAMEMQQCILCVWMPNTAGKIVQYLNRSVLCAVRNFHYYFIWIIVLISFLLCIETICPYTWQNQNMKINLFVYYRHNFKCAEESSLISSLDLCNEYVCMYVCMCVRMHYWHGVNDFPLHIEHNATQASLVVKQQRITISAKWIYNLLPCKIESSVIFISLLFYKVSVV